MEKKQFEQLKRIYGSHLAVAAALGVTRRTYLNYRKGKVPKPIEKLIHSTLDQHATQQEVVSMPDHGNDQAVNQ